MAQLYESRQPPLRGSPVRSEKFGPLYWPVVMVIRNCIIYVSHLHLPGVGDLQICVTCQQTCHAILCLIASQLDTEGLVMLEPRT